MTWKHLPIVAFDTETTGLDPFDGNRVIEIAAVKFMIAPDGTILSEEPFSHLLNPGMPIPRTASEITGITDKDVQGAKIFAEIADELRELLHGAITVAHNYPFDMKFLTQEYARLDERWPEPVAEVDTFNLSRKHLPDAKDHKLKTLCDRLGVSLEGAHRATNDAAACGKSFLELVKRHQVADDLQAMLAWGPAIGHPPEGALILNEAGAVVFRDGPHAGKFVGDQPIHLAWMEKARIRGANGWQFRFDDATRAWVRRWLDVRGAGIARSNPKTFHEGDWVIDPCIAPEVRP